MDHLMNCKTMKMLPLTFMAADIFLYYLIMVYDAI